MILRNKKITLSQLSMLWSVWTLLAFNLPFFRFVTIHADGSVYSRLFLIGSLGVVMVILNGLLINLLLFFTHMVGRVVLAILNIINAVCTFFVVNYHVLMDGTMMANVFNTRYSEADGFVSWVLIVWVLSFGVLPSAYILFRKIENETLRRVGQNSGFGWAVVAILILANLPQTRWFGRYDTALGGLLMPWSYIVNTGRVLAQRTAQNRKEILLPDACITNNKKSTVVLVIGESARKVNFSLYGYEVLTNPKLSRVTDLQVLEAEANATYTTAGVLAILSAFESRELYEILPNYLYRHGVDVVWRTSNWGEPPLHFPKYTTREDLAIKYDKDPRYDEVLFCGLRSDIEQCLANKQLIVLHTSTSHGPDYSNQYPLGFVSRTTNNIVDEYDNTIRYTDSLLANLIDTLRTIDTRSSTMIYISDHGESLGENEIYMHGLPLKMAPKEQIEIPCLIWTSEESLEIRKDLKLVNQRFVFHSVLHALGMNSPIFNKTCDFFEDNSTKME